MNLLLSIVEGGSKRRRSSSVSLINLTSLGRRFLRSPLPLRGGKLSPSSKRSSMAENTGNPRSLSTIAFFSVGISACNAEYMVLVENVSCFTSEKASSLGTYTELLLFSDNGSVQQPINNQK